jgi:hypothetical protein
MLRSSRNFRNRSGEGALLVHHADHLRPLDLECDAVGYGDGRGQTQPRHCRQRPLTDKLTRGEQRDGGFLAGLRDDREFGASALQIEDAFGRIALGEESLLGHQPGTPPPQPGLRQENSRIELLLTHIRHANSRSPPQSCLEAVLQDG